MPTWTTPGTYTWVVPSGVTELLALDLAGGQGGADWSGTATPGNGGRLQAATIGVNPGDTLTIVVGAQGAQGATGDDGSGAEGTGAAGGNGATTLVTVSAVTVAGEGRSGGGGGGGGSCVHHAAGLIVVTAIAAGGGGAGGSWPTTPADVGGAGGHGSSAGVDGSNGQATTLGPGSAYYKGIGGGISSGGGSEGVVGNFGRKGSARNGAWCTGAYTPTAPNPRTGGGGAGGSALSTSRGGGAREQNVSGAGGGGAGGTQTCVSSHASPTGVTHTTGYRSGDGYVTFTYTGEFAADGWSVGFLKF